MLIRISPEPCHVAPPCFQDLPPSQLWALGLTRSARDVDDVLVVEVDRREDVGDERWNAECRPPFSSMGAGGVVNDSAAVCILMEEWSIDRGAASAGWLQVNRKIIIGMITIVAAMFDGKEKEESPLSVFMYVTGKIPLCH